MDSIRASVQQAMTLRLRIAECKRILEYAQQYADKRWDDNKHSFMDLDRYVENPHVVNTSTALSVIASCPSVFDQSKLEAFDGVRLAGVIKFFIDNYRSDRNPPYWPSKDNPTWSPYVTALALKAIGAVAIANSETENLGALIKTQKAIAEILRSQIHELQNFLEKWASQNLERELLDYDHTFFAYTALSSSETIFQAVDSFGEQFVNKSDRDKRETIKQAVLKRLRLDFYSHMTFKLAGVSQHLDVVSLALSMYCLTAYSMEREIPEDVLDAALNTVFSLQLPSGFWNTSTPLLGAATGRVGCSSVELASCLLKIPRTRKNYGQFFDSFNTLLTQLSRGFDFKDPERGWPTDLRRNGDSYQTWYTFAVFQYLTLLTGNTSDYAAEILLQDFNYHKSKPKLTWTQIGDYDGYKERVQSAFIGSRNGGTQKPKYSMILFGPPGTGKTSIANALAYELGWTFIEIGPGDFLTNGVDGIFAQGDLIFQRLLLLDHVVVLFDEIDELVASRTDEADIVSKFLTTYMLPWLQRLRDKASVIFIFATNHISRFDPAIRRHGRFDLIVPIGPPQGTERERILRALSGQLGIDDTILSKIVKIIPDQATIGDISSATARAITSTGFNEAIFQEQMAPERLLIREVAGNNELREWTEFLDDAKRYS
jgi:hypothetical protein